jgi:hypothetical protein
MGHVPFGIHDSLTGPAEYITLLRDPVERVISNYYYIRRSPKHRFYDALEDLSIQQYVKNGINPLIENGMVRFLSGRAYDRPGKVMLKEAKDNLREHFGVVGLVEKFDESLLLMASRYNWSNIAYRRRNATKTRPTREDLSSSVIESIQRHNRLDIELYRYARERLTRDLRTADLDLENKLRWLQGGCRLHAFKHNVQVATRNVLGALGLK